jgi:hypothetical protein
MHDLRTPGHGRLRRLAHLWAANAEKLACWVRAHLVNRQDVWGNYLSRDQRTPRKKVLTRTGTLSQDILITHFVGADHGDLIGLHTTCPNNTCRWVLVDIDQHGTYSKDRHSANRQAAIRLYDRLVEMRFAPLLLSSNGQGGYHLYCLFSTPLTAPTAYAFGRWLVRDWRDLGPDEPPEAFPKQRQIGGKVRYGNWVRLPGRHHTLDFYTRVWAGNRWVDGQRAIDAILSTTGSDPALIPAEAIDYDPDSIKQTPPTNEPSDAPSRPGPRVRSLSRTRPIDRVLALLKNVVPTDSGWSARCPAHFDAHNSFSVAVGADERVLLYCHAGCTIGEIVDALGLSVRDLFAHQRRRRPLRYRREVR